MNGLEAMARRVREGDKASTKQWRMPEPDDFFHGCVMAFDQSLSATGVVVLVNDGVEGLRVLWAGTVRTKTTEGLGGHEENLERALDIRHRYTEVLNNRWIKDMSVVHEMVPVGGPLRSPESSLLAAVALRIAAEDLGCPLEPSVAPKRHRKAICGNANAKKPEAHRALTNLATLLPIGGYSLVTNEATRDALAIGLTHLLRGAHG